MNLAARCRRLAEDLDAAAAVDTLRSIDEIVRRGRPGDEEPPIFVAELAQARARGRASGRRRPEVLILTVGYSPDPLFLSLAYHAPEKVVLLLERRLARTYLDALPKNR